MRRAAALDLVPADAALLAYGDAHLLDGRRVEGGGQADRLGEDGGIAVIGDAVERFAPPIIFGDSQAWNRAGLVDELRCLLFGRQASDEIVDAPLDRQRRVAERQRLVRLDRFRPPDCRGGEQADG
jgi:hypothetical protein